MSSPLNLSMKLYTYPYRQFSQEEQIPKYIQELNEKETEEPTWSKSFSKPNVSPINRTTRINKE